MFRFAGSLVIAAVFVVGLPAFAEEEAPPTIARSYLIKAHSGHEAKFEAAMKKQIAWYKENDETWQWHTWRWETGENSGSYVFRSPGHHWKDLDERAERTTRAAAHFQEVLGPHIESTTGTRMLRWLLSAQMTLKNTPPMGR